MFSLPQKVVSSNRYSEPIYSIAYSNNVYVVKSDNVIIFKNSVPYHYVSNARARNLNY